MRVTCLNCATEFKGNFCPNCGQKHGPAMPDSREVIGDLLRSALSPSGKIVETLVTLYRRPGELSRAYLSGQRNRYVHPVRVYLLCVFVFVAIASLNGTWRSWTGQKPFEQASSEIFKPATPSSEGEPTQTAKPDGSAKSDSASYKAGRVIGESAKASLPPWLQEKMRERAKTIGERSAAEMEQRVYRSLTQNYSLLFALLVPIMAFINWMLYAGRGITYGGHFVFVLHATAGGSLIFALPYLFNAPLAYWPATLVSMLWQILSARHAFGVSIWAAFWRYVVYLLPSILISGVVGITMAFFHVVFAS
ncbi:MAG: DUF3667 domain-containing protein [Burkholderiales bacterium]|nr:MAG: DUF3667 domain-containing protein [Burkholderiales bacterium]TAG84202.1 MAG: DUF3667 domain-containing protein [Betaproteobacteria bacterium]